MIISSPLRSTHRIAMVLLAFASASCNHHSNSSVSNAASAQNAYFGLDLSIDKAIQLGMQGFNAATNANIPPQTGPGDVAGTLEVSGQVDQGASTNKTMNLLTTYTGYEDAPVLPTDAGVLHIVYNGVPSTTTLSIMLKNIPTGTFTGTFTQTLMMSGDLTGAVTLNLALSGDIELVPGSSTQIQRKVGTTHITGTATSAYGTFNVDVTR